MYIYFEHLHFEFVHSIGMKPNLIILSGNKKIYSVIYVR